MPRSLALGLIVVSLALPFVACGGDEDSTANPPDDSAGGSSGSSGQGGAGTTAQGGAGQAGMGQGGSPMPFAGTSGAAGATGGGAGTAGGAAGGAGTEGGSAGTAGATGGSAGTGGTTGGSAGATGGSAGSVSGTGPYCGATKEELPSISKCDDPAPSACATAMCSVTGADAPKDCKQILLDCYADEGCNKSVACGAVCRDPNNPNKDPDGVIGKCTPLAGSGASIGKALAYKGCADKLTACGGDGTYNP